MSDIPTTPQHAPWLASQPVPAPTAPPADATPAHREALGSQMAVKWAGQTILLPPSVDDWDPDVLEAFENGKAIGALRTLLGSDNYEAARRQFARDNGRKPTVGDLTGLVSGIAEAYGFDGPGE